LILAFSLPSKKRWGFTKQQTALSCALPFRGKEKNGEPLLPWSEKPNTKYEKITDE